MDDVAGPLRWAACDGIAISPRSPVGGFHATWEPKDNEKGFGQAICWNRQHLELFARSISVMNFKWNRDVVLAGGGMPLSGRAWELANRRVSCGLVENTDRYRNRPAFFQLQKGGGLYCSISGFRFARVSLAEFPHWEGTHHYPETAAHPVRRREASRLGYMIYHPGTAGFVVPKTPAGSVKAEIMLAAWNSAAENDFIKCIRSPCKGAVICWTQEDAYALIARAVRKSGTDHFHWTVRDCGYYCTYDYFKNAFRAELGVAASPQLIAAAGYSSVGVDLLEVKNDVPF